MNGPQKRKKKLPVKEVKLAVDFLVDRNTGLEVSFEVSLGLLFG